MKKTTVFRDYAETYVRTLVGFTVSNAFTGASAADDGMVIELERDIDNVTIGIDIVFSPVPEEGETQFMISNEYVKRIND